MGNKCFFVFIFILLLVACSREMNFQTEGAFVILTIQQAGPDDFRNMFSKNYALDREGILTLYAQGDDRLKVGEDAPVFSKQLTKEEIEEIQKLIQKNRIWQLEEELSNEYSVDGSFIYITIKQTEQAKTVGGLNPDDPGFLEVVDFITGLVNDKEYSTWENAITDYIYNMNPVQ